MCKFSYVSGACANRRVDSIHCIGENECEFSGMNLLGASRDIDDHDPLAEEWHQLYCETHGRFLCKRSKGDCAPPRGRSGVMSYRQRTLTNDGQETW